MSLSNPTPLIPRKSLFGNPEKEAARISPDGTKLLYLAPHEGKQSVWVRTIGEADDRVVASDPSRPIGWANWQGDGLHVLYLQDQGGNENFHLFQVDLRGATARDLTPFPGIRAMPIALDAQFPQELLITLNARSPKLFDVHRIELASGMATLDTENPGDVLLWLADQRFVIRAALAQLLDGSYEIRVRETAASPWRVLDSFPFEDGTPRLVAFSPDDSALCVITAKDSNATRLVRYELGSGSYTALFGDNEFDIERAYIDPMSHEIVALSVLRERLHWTALNLQFAEDFKALAEARDGDITIESVSADGGTWIVRYQMDCLPDHYCMYSRVLRQTTLLFRDRPELVQHTLAPMQPISFPARDGLAIAGYLTVPSGIAPRNLPMVLYVHGGPWHRDRWGYDAVVQWLANRGYAVLQVNFRGSTGYGKNFLNAGNREWAGAMRTDLLDARDWAIEQGIADPARVAIFGASYGGYAVLTALAWTPELFACGIDVVGPSDLRTFLATIPQYWEPMRRLFAERVGDDPEFLKSQSPLMKAASIRAPLLIVQGANDPRVNQRESDQIVAAIRKNNIPVDYIILDDEGHGIANPRNMLAFAATCEVFLARVLGGRLEPGP